MCEVGGGGDKSCCISLDNYNLKSLRLCTCKYLIIAAQKHFFSFINIF